MLAGFGVILGAAALAFSSIQPASAASLIATVPVGNQPDDVAVNPATNRVYVANEEGASVTVIDGASNSIVTTVSVGFKPRFVAVNPSTNRIYVTHYFLHSVSVIDGASNSVIASILLGATNPNGVAVNPLTNRVYVAGIADSSQGGSVQGLFVIDGGSNTLVTVVPMGNDPASVAVNPSTNRVYVTTPGSPTGNTVRVVDGFTNTVVATILVPSQSSDVAVNPSTNRIYVTLPAVNMVSVVDGATNAVLTNVTVGTSPSGIDTDSASRIYVANSSARTLSIIDGTTDTVAETVALAVTSGIVFGVGANPTTHRVYVSHQQANLVSVVQDTPPVVGPPAVLTLEPPTATNTVGSQHCVTATVKDASATPVAGVTVIFSVPTSVVTDADPSSGAATTNSSGEASFCYSASLPGEDTIHAFADSDNSGAQDPGEPFDEATKTWTLPASTAFCEVTITNGGWIIANNGDSANVGGNAKVAADGTTQGQEQYTDHGPAQPMTLHSIRITATTCSSDRTTATIFGDATVDGSGSYAFRIDVIDNGESGTNDAYGIIVSNGYTSGVQTLQGGNVKIH